jgi:hypothetical protein
MGIQREINVHHANEPYSRKNGSGREIRRGNLCLAPLIHLLRGLARVSPGHVCVIDAGEKKSARGYVEEGN